MVEIYGLKTDSGEMHNLAPSRPDLVVRAEGILKTAHVDSPDWSVKAAKEKKAKR